MQTQGEYDGDVEVMTVTSRSRMMRQSAKQEFSVAQSTLRKPATPKTGRQLNASKRDHVVNQSDLRYEDFIPVSRVSTSNAQQRRFTNSRSQSFALTPTINKRAPMELDQQIVVQRAPDDMDEVKCSHPNLYRRANREEVTIYEQRPRSRQVRKLARESRDDLETVQARMTRKHQCQELIVQKPVYVPYIKTDNPDSVNTVKKGRKLFARPEDIPKSPPLEVIDVSFRTIQQIPIYRRPEKDELQKLSLIYRQKADGLEHLLHVPVIDPQQIPEFEEDVYGFKRAIQTASLADKEFYEQPIVFDQPVLKPRKNQHIQPMQLSTQPSIFNTPPPVQPLARKIDRMPDCSGISGFGK